jgi:DNA-entry nuclease
VGARQTKARRGWRIREALLTVALAVGVLVLLAVRVGLVALPMAPVAWSDEADSGSAGGVGALPVREVSYTPWDEDAYPQYVREIGPAVVDVEIPAGEVWYAPLDELGRTVRAAGCIDYATMRAGIDRERGDLKGHDPSGWGHNEWVEIPLPDGGTYQGWIWNRSHLVAKSLGGSDEVENLVCGTYVQNVAANDEQGGMAYGETLARAWLAHHRTGTLFYSAIPAYEGDEPVCRSVIVDIRSSDGTLDVELEVYNAALGYEVDYATGTVQGG